MILFPIVLAVLSLSKCCESSRILAIMPTPSYSHQVVFKPLWSALLSRGHHITLLTTDPIKENAITSSNFNQKGTSSNLQQNGTSSNFRQVDWSFAYQLWHDKHNLTNIIANFKTNLVKCVMQYVVMMNDITEQELNHPKVKTIIANHSEHFDLVITEILNPAMMMFSHRFNAPFIGISPMDMPTFFHESAGNPTSPAAFTDFFSPYDFEMSFWERVVNLVYYLGSNLFFKYHFYPQADEVARRHFGDDIPKLEHVRDDASMIFLNIHPLMHGIRPLMPHVLMVGGGVHLENDSPLPQDLQQFLDNSTAGAIYFSLGTNAKGTDMSDFVRNTFIETFLELPYKVVWKYEDTHMEDSGKFFIKPWLPQQSILKHPNVKLFITQGGLQSLEEAIFNAVPVIGMPVFLDQIPNIRRIVKRGIGISLEYDQIDRVSLKKAILEVITNSSYKQKIQELSSLIKEQPVSGLDQMIFWTEYVINNPGAPVLRRTELPLYQYLMLDQLLLFFLCLCCIVLCYYYILKYLLKMWKRCRNQDVKLKFE